MKSAVLRKMQTTNGPLHGCRFAILKSSSSPTAQPPQLTKIYINDGNVTLAIEASDFENYEVAGWTRGKAPVRLKWMHKEGLEKLVEESHMMLHISKGWAFGRAALNLGRPKKK